MRSPWCRLIKRNIPLKKIENADDQEYGDTDHDDRLLHRRIVGQDMVKGKCDIALKKLNQGSADPHIKSNPEAFLDRCFSHRQIDRSHRKRPEEAAEPAPAEMNKESQYF